MVCNSYIEHGHICSASYFAIHSAYFITLFKSILKQVRIHEANSRVYWAGAVMPENHEKMKFRTFGTFLKI